MIYVMQCTHILCIGCETKKTIITLVYRQSKTVNTGVHEPNLRREVEVRCTREIKPGLSR